MVIKFLRIFSYLEAQTVKLWNGETEEGLAVTTKMVPDANATITWEVNDQLDVEDPNGQFNSGYTDEIGNTQENRIQINAYTHFGKDGKVDNVTDENMTRATETGTHENTHVVGGKHYNDPSIGGFYKYKIQNHIQNIMHGNGGLEMLPEQRSIMLNLIEKQQPEKENKETPK